jgi:hypothetical protein
MLLLGRVFEFFVMASNARAEGIDVKGETENSVFAQQVGEILVMAFRRMAYDLSLGDASRQLVDSFTILSLRNKTNQLVSSSSPPIKTCTDFSTPVFRMSIYLTSKIRRRHS